MILLLFALAVPAAVGASLRPDGDRAVALKLVPRDSSDSRSFTVPHFADGALAVASKDKAAAREVALVATAAVMAIAVTLMSTTNSILTSVASALSAPAADHVRVIDAETTRFMEDLLGLYSSVTGDLNNRFSDAVQDIGMWVLKTAPDADILDTATKVLAGDPSEQDEGLMVLRALQKRKPVTDAKKIRDELLCILRGDYDGSMGFGIDPDSVTPRSRLFNGTAPKLASLANMIKAPGIYLHAGGDSFIDPGAATDKEDAETAAELSAPEDAAKAAAADLQSIGAATFAAPFSIAGDSVSLVSNLQTGAGLAVSALQMMSQVMQLRTAVRALRTAKFTAARTLGVAAEAAVVNRELATINSCALFAVLHGALLEVLALKPGEVEASNLVSLLGLDAVKLSDPRAKALTALVYERLHSSLAPLAKRVRSVFRSQGRCARLAGLYGAPTSSTHGSPALRDFTAPRLDSCEDNDVYDVVLTAREHVDAWKAAGYERTWNEEVRLAGELNTARDELMGHRYNVTKTKNSRLLMMLRCKALKDQLTTATGERLAALKKLTVPVTALSLVARPKPTSMDDNLGALGPAEKALTAQGYEQLQFLDAPGSKPVTATVAAMHVKEKLRVAKDFVKGKIWDSLDVAQYMHGDPSDVHAGRGRNRLRLYMYVKRGGCMPLTNILYIPFHVPIETWGPYSETGQSELLAHEKELKDKSGTTKPDEKEVKQLLSPPGCTVTDIIDKSSERLKWKGLKRWGLNVLLGRGGHKQVATKVLHRFKTACRLPPNMRWDRLPVSPMDDVTKDAAMLDTGYLWLQRRLALPPMPTGDAELPQYTGPTRAELEQRAAGLPQESAAGVSP